MGLEYYTIWLKLYILNNVSSESNAKWFNIYHTLLFNLPKQAFTSMPHKMSIFRDLWLLHYNETRVSPCYVWAPASSISAL